MYIAIANFPMGKTIWDYMNATGIELDEDTVFHLDGILMERELKARIVELNDLEAEVVKHIDYYTSAVIGEDLAPFRKWVEVSVELTLYCVLEMSRDDWAAVVAGDEGRRDVMAAAIASARRL